MGECIKPPSLPQIYFLFVALNEMPCSRRELVCCHFFFLFLHPGKVHRRLIGVGLVSSPNCVEQEPFPTCSAGVRGMRGALLVAT